MKEVATFDDPAKAQLAAGFLRSHGIDAYAADAHTLGAMPHLRLGLGGSRVMAREEDIDTAKRLLATVERSDLDPIVCPECGGRRIAKRRDIRFPLFHALVFFLFPFAPPTGELKCQGCKHVWHPEDEETAVDEHG